MVLLMGLVWLCGCVCGFEVWFVSGVLRLCVVGGCVVVCVVGWLGCVVGGMVRCVDVSVLFVSF